MHKLIAIIASIAVTLFAVATLTGAQTDTDDETTPRRRGLRVDPDLHQDRPLGQDAVLPREVPGAVVEVLSYRARRLLALVLGLLALGLGL